MPVLQGTLVDVTAGPSTASEVWVRAPRGRVSGTRVVVPETRRVEVKNGEFEVNVEPGPAYLVVVHATGPQEHVPLLVQEGMTTIAEAVRLGDESWADFTPSQADAIRAEVVASVAQARQQAQDAAASATAASKSASGAASSASQAKASAQAASTAEKNAKTAESGAVTAQSEARKSAEAAASSASKASTSEQNAGESATSAKQDADRAANIASSTSWNGDKLTVNGKTSPSLTGPKGDPGDVSKSQLDTAIASEKARTVGVTWTVPRESDVAAKARVAQTGDYIQVAQTHTIYRIASGGVEVERYGTRTLQASTGPNSNKNPANWVESSDPWWGVSWSRLSPPAGEWIVELINPHDFSAELYVEGSSVGAVTKGTMAHLSEFSTAAKSDVFVQIPGENHDKPIILRFTPIN